MKKIIMIGELNSITQNIFRSLVDRFYVQFCPADEELLEKICRLVAPELILVSLVGVDESCRPVLAELREKHSKTPVLCVGNPGELQTFEQEIDGEQFVKIVRPVTIMDIIKSIEAALHISSKSPQTKSVADNRKRILLVDDSPIQLRTMKALLQDEYIVDMATSAEEAMKLIYKNVPDLIFLDYDMPKCDGRMTFEMLKEEPISSYIPVVFLTGVSERQRVLSVLNMYPADYLVKPVDKSRIIDTIQNVLGQTK